MLSSYPVNTTHDHPFGHTRHTSEYSRPNYSHCRSPSIMSASSSNSICVSVVLHKARPSLTLSHIPANHNPVGAFTPTSPASSALRLFINPPEHTSLFARSFKRRRTSKSKLSGYDHESPTSKPESDYFDTSIPSISRGLSEPSTPTSISTSTLDTLSTPSPRPSPKPKTGLNPILASLEKKSKLCTLQMHCATCDKPGTNFPRCGKCGQTWCSRECRLPGGMKHICSLAPR